MLHFSLVVLYTLAFIFRSGGDYLLGGAQGEKKAVRFDIKANRVWDEEHVVIS